MSFLFKGNNGYIPVCRHCIDQIYAHFVDFYSGSEEKAIERMCQIFDWFFHEEPLAASRKISANRSRIGGYVSKLNLRQTTMKGTTYSDTIIGRYANTIDSVEHLEELKSQGKTSVTKTALERWGANFFEDEIRTLEDHYRMLKNQNPNCDSNQEIFIKDLCYTKLQQIEAMREKDVKNFDTLTKLYRDTFKQAGLKTIQETDSSNEETLGVTLATISQYTPEEYYRDKSLYKDFDGLSSYIERFLFRPLKNLMTGSKERDEEFCVKDDDDGDEE